MITDKADEKKRLRRSWWIQGYTKWDEPEDYGEPFGDDDYVYEVDDPEPLKKYLIKGWYSYGWPHDGSAAHKWTFTYFDDDEDEEVGEVIVWIKPSDFGEEDDDEDDDEYDDEE